MTVEKSMAVLAGLTALFLLAVQFLYINEYAASWDQVDFALALDRFDLLAMQPHFPGYPYFILGGTMIHLFIKEGAGALTLFNIIMYASSVLPIFWLFRRFFTVYISMIAAVLLYSAPYPLLIINQPMSEGAALSCLWWYIWSIQKALETEKRIVQIIPFFLFSVLLGIRLSYLLLGIGLIYLLFIKWKNKRYSIRRIFGYLAAALFFQLIWAGALVYSEGGLIAFMKLALAFTDGHFNQWGNTAVSDSKPVWERAFILLFKNGIWIGIWMQTVLIAVLYTILILFSVKKRRTDDTGFVRLLMIMAVSYSFWALLAQNIDKPRHFLPVISIGLFLFFCYVLKHSNTCLVGLVSALFIIQSAAAASSIKEQAETLPASYQLDAFFDKKTDQPVIYTWEEARVLDYLDASVVYKEIQTYERFMQDQSYYENRPVYITGKVVEGFKAQGHDISSQLKEVATFKSNPLFDPVYSRIVLYQWENKRETDYSK